MKPAYKDYIWGGSKLKDTYNKNTPYDITAESWEVSCCENGMSRICGGDHDGQTLGEAIENAAKKGIDWLGSNCHKFEGFPILIKLIDANDSLSIQVHPNDEYARINENGSNGKTEVWYVAEAEPDAELVYGFSKNVTREEIRKAIENNELKPYLNFVKIKAGDVLFVRSGLVHAIGKGTFICEIQQNSNITYRVYDWGRVGSDGKPRQLHIENALDVMDFSEEKDFDFSPKFVFQVDDVAEYSVANCEYFKVRKRVQEKESVITTDNTSFVAITFVKGEGCIFSKDGHITFSQGDSFFLPALCEEYKVVGECEFLITRV